LKLPRILKKDTASLLYSFEPSRFLAYISHQVNPGNKIIFNGAFEASDEKGLYQLNLEDQSLENLIQSEMSFGFPALSPDGEKVLFSSYRSGQNQLWMYDLKNARYSQITDHQNVGLNFRSYNWKSDNEIYILQYNEQDRLNQIKKITL
jgi:Tol biopolymer transport system component